jgi:FMN-dependent oxidoreductase (nitrilotriacetate monooxygenase family)
MRDRKMHLLAYVKTGPTAQLAGAWRHPEADLDDIFEPERYEHMARVLGAARFDGCFFADTLGLPDIYKGSFDTYLRYGGQLSYLDPMIVLPVMARATRHLGLGATLSTTFHHPYHLARILASLDHLSHGRACWNVVTSTTDFEARNFGLAGLPAKELRYDRADEVVEACCALWDCWQEDALVMAKESGLFIDPEKVRYADYEGRYVRTRGPLTIPRSPQGRPVLMQAGSSPRGRDFAARWAEAIYCSSGSKNDATEFYTDIKERMARFGRAPADCAICTSTTVVLGETEAIAREKAEYLFSLVPLEMVLATNSAMLGADLSQTRDAVAQQGSSRAWRLGGPHPPDDAGRRHQLRRGDPPAAQPDGRHAGDDRRQHAGSVRVRSLRRVCADTDDLAGHVGGIRRHADTGTATPRSAAHRVHGRHDAREFA